MQYTGFECPVCGEKFTEGDDVVVCPICGTPHHRECWRKSGGCKHEDKHSEGFIWQMPEALQNTNANMPNRRADGNFKVCPRCGEKNSPYEPVCTKCGERLKANRQTINDQMPFGGQRPFYGYGANPNPNNFSPYQNVYAADARTVYGEDAKIDDIPVTEAAEYVQKNSTKYVGDFLHFQEKNTKLKWNWSAAVFSVFWCFYRKMTAYGLALIAILFSANLLSSYIPLAVYEKYQPAVYEEYSKTIDKLNEAASDAISGGGQADASRYYSVFAEYLLSPVTVTSNIMMAAFYLIVSVIFGFLGTYFYKKKAVKDIKAMRQVAVDNMTYHMLLRQRGGVSVFNLLIPIACNMILNMLLNYL